MILERIARSFRPLARGDNAVSFLLAAGVAGALVGRAVHLAGATSPLTARAEKEFFF